MWTPPVTGPRKLSRATSRSCASPPKRSISAAGSCVPSSGGMKPARAILQNGVAVNVSCHHLRQRAIVRRSTDTTWLKRSSRASLTPCCRMVISTTMVATYTLRPRKRSDGGVARERQPSTAQQKLKRWSCSGPRRHGRPRGFAGVARHVPAPATGAALGPASLRQITVDGEQEVMESGIGQQRCVQGCVPPDRRRSTPMAKPGRNDRCPCGSGKKYKVCCLTRDEAAEHERLAAQQAERDERAAAKRLELRKVRDAIAANFATSLDDGEGDLEETVNAALRSIHEGKLEQIETAARHLMERYPDIPDGWEFLGHVHEKRGENREAVACYRRVLEIINRTPDDFDPQYTQRFEDQIAKLDQPQAT